MARRWNFAGQAAGAMRRADFASAFHEVIDFVPHEDDLKQLARDRYKAYRSVGFQLTTATPPTQ